MDKKRKTRMGNSLTCKKCFGTGKIELIVNGRFTGLVEECDECNKERKNEINSAEDNTKPKQSNDEPI